MSIDLPAFVEFKSPVESLGIAAGDRVWVTDYGATLARSLPINDLHRHLHLAQVVRVGESPSLVREVDLDHPGASRPS